MHSFAVKLCAVSEFIANPTVSYLEDLLNYFCLDVLMCRSVLF